MEKENLNIVLKISKDGKVKFEIGKPKYLTDEEVEKQDKEFNKELKNISGDISKEEIKRQRRELIEGIKSELTLDDYGRELLNKEEEHLLDSIDPLLKALKDIEKKELHSALYGINEQAEIMRNNLDSILRPQYYELAESFTNQINVAQGNLNIEAIDSLLNQTNPLINIHNSLGNELAQYDISELATKALVDFDILLDEALPNQSAELAHVIDDLYLEKHLTDLLGLYELKHNNYFIDDEKQSTDDTKYKKANQKDLKELVEIMAIKHGINKQLEELTKADIEIITSKESMYVELKKNKKQRSTYLHYIFIGRAIISFLDRQLLNTKTTQIKKPTPNEVFHEIKYHYQEFDIDGIIEPDFEIKDNSFEWKTTNGTAKTCNLNSTILTRVFNKFNPKRKIYTALNQNDISNFKNRLK